MNSNDPIQDTDILGFVHSHWDSLSDDTRLQIRALVFRDTDYGKGSYLNRKDEMYEICRKLRLTRLEAEAIFHFAACNSLAPANPSNLLQPGLDHDEYWQAYMVFTGDVEGLVKHYVEEFSAGYWNHVVFDDRLTEAVEREMENNPRAIKCLIDLEHLGEVFPDKPWQKGVSRGLSASKHHDAR